MKQTEILFREFKSEIPAFRICGKIQLVCFVVLIASVPSLVWINWKLILKIDLTFFVLQIMIGIIYRYLEKKARSEFEKLI